MKLTKLTCEEFAMKLASKEPVPGGGGAAALVGALGVALNSMVANYSIGKRKVLNYSKEHENIINKGNLLRKELIELINKDAENFEPLSKAYIMPSSTDEEIIAKNKTMQKCLKVACSAPLRILQCTYESILLHEDLVDISSKALISDIGVGVQFLKSALYSAQLNILININLMDDEEYVKEIKDKTKKIVDDGAKISDEVFNKVMIILNN